MTSKPSKVNDNLSYAFLFDKKSTQVVSRPIHIDECQALKISTFNLPDNVRLNIHRIILGGGSMPQGAGCLCEGSVGSIANVIASEQLKINCKPVYIDNCNSVLFLTVPGSYVLELSDGNVLGQFLAMAELVECCCLPTGLVIGNVTHNSIVGV